MDLMRSLDKRSVKLINSMFDPAALSLTEDTLASMTQRDPSLPLYEDRKLELAEFYGMTPEQAGQIASIEDKDALENMFVDTDTDTGLLDNYRAASLLYTGRLMMKYTRFPVAVKLIPYLNSKFIPAKRKNIRVLDYGCGVGDYGLAFATQGYRITVLDIEGGNLDFAKWRFDQRNIPVDVVPVTDDNLYPALEPHNIVLAGELLEHVRDPIAVLKNIFDSTPKGGYLWLSGYPEFEREVGGDHLQEAADVRLEALDLLLSHTEKVRVNLPGSLFKVV